MSRVFHIHFLLIISAFLFSISTISFIKRVGKYYESISLVSITSINNVGNYQHEFFSFTTKATKYDFAVLDKSTNENLSVSKRTSNSILDRFQFINPPKPICTHSNSAENFMIFIVLSRGINFDYRQAIRATWGRNGPYKNSSIYVQTLFFVGTDDRTQASLRSEQASFNDVIEIVIPEGYSFVAHKELASLYWTRLYCPFARLLFRADDDILLDTYLLLKTIEDSIDLRMKDGLYGWFRLNNSVHRADRWAVTKDEYNEETYPPYTFGIGYLFSNVSCQRLIDATQHPHHQIIRIGDVYITGILRELAQVDFYNFLKLEYAYTFVDPIACNEHFEQNPNLLICMSKLHIGKRDEQIEFYDIWNLILNRHNISL